MKDGEKDIEQQKQIMNETLASMIEDCSRHMDIDVEKMIANFNKFHEQLYKVI